MSDDSRRKLPAIPRPSSSIVLISPQNQVLLLHRVRTSNAFPSAHVFPGGNVSANQDGTLPGVEHPDRHIDGPAYRLAAVRETFEESGILLARRKAQGHNGHHLLEVGEREREQARKAVHKGEKFVKWLEEKGGVADVENLIPFTRWITPRGIPRRYTTQMYLYFWPTASSSSTSQIPLSEEAMIPTPTPDGGVEHTAAQFLHAETWLNMARSEEVILFPPQFFLLFLISKFLYPPPMGHIFSSEEIEQQRSNLRRFVYESTPPWTDVCVSPGVVAGDFGRGKWVLSLDNTGSEVAGQKRPAAEGYVVLMGGKQGQPSGIEIKLKKDLKKKPQTNL